MAQLGGGAPPVDRKEAARLQPSTPEAPVRESRTPPVEELRPSVFYLPDQKGSLQPILDFKYQDFVDLYKLKSGIGQRDEPPRYSLQTMTATGSAGEEYAELSIKFQVLVRDDGWVRVPLRLDQGVLRGAVKYKGPGEQFVHYENGGEGYVCWLRGKSETQHEITLTLLTPLSVVGDEPRLNLFAPRATTSELKLTVPMVGAVGRVSEGATLVSTTVADTGGTVLNVAGLGGDFSVAWHKANPRPTESPLLLESATNVFTLLDGRSISAEATLVVRSYGAPFDRFAVRLPPGTELSPSVSNGYVVTPKEPDPKERNSAARVVNVQLSKKTVGPVEVRLTCRRSYDPLKDAAWCELAGFEVLGASRQWGVIAVAAPGDWQVLWGTSGETRETDQVPDALRKDDVAASFEYSTQPYSLNARLVPRKTRISVEPKYVMQVEPGELRLEGKLSYTIRGAKTATLDIGLPGWELDEVGPDNIVAVAGVVAGSGNVAVPLIQPMSGVVELRLRAHRALDAGAKSFRTGLPQPKVNSAAPLSLAVSPADNVELTPDAAKIEGLARQRGSQAQQRLPERQQDPFYYRGTAATSAFAADVRVHRQRIAVDAATQVLLGTRTAEVEQRLSYAIAYEPADRLTIAVPRILASGKKVQVVCDGKPLALTVSADELAGGDALRPVSMRAVLPTPRIGTCDLTLQYTIPLNEPPVGQTVSLSVPLPMPEDGQLATNTVCVKGSQNLRPSLRQEKGCAWAVADADASSSSIRTPLRLAATKASDRVELVLRWETDEPLGATIVDRAWIQSWFSVWLRQDRAVYQLSTNRKEVEVTLPAGVSAEQTVVLIDGKQVETRAGAEGVLQIPLPGPREKRRLVVELSYGFGDSRPLRGAISIEFPRFGPNTWVRRTYWQLILPENEHLMGNPEGFTGEFSWEWRGYFWGRRPLLDQAQLEAWTGATPQSAIPERANQYLFSTLSDASQASIHTASRTWIVLLASSVALIAGLLLIYVPASRHPATLLATALGLSAAGLVAPEPTLLLAQAASLGLVLTLLAGYLERGMARRRHRAAMRIEPSNSRLELGSTRSRRQPSLNGPASTETLPAISPPQPGNTEQ